MNKCKGAMGTLESGEKDPGEDHPRLTPNPSMTVSEDSKGCTSTEKDEGRGWQNPWGTTGEKKERG